MRHIYNDRHINDSRTESIYKPSIYLQQGNWTIDNTLRFYRALSRYTQLKGKELITNCHYFGKQDIEYVEEIESIMNPMGRKKPYDSMISTINFARMHRQKTSLSDSIATRLTQLHTIYVEAGRKHTMSQINDKIFAADSIYLVQLDSLSKTGRLFEYTHTDEFGKEICRVMRLKTPGDFKDFVLQESALLIKALVRYTLTPNLFYSVDSVGNYVKPIYSGRPIASTPVLSDAEQYIRALLGRHGVVMMDYLIGCITNATNAFINDSPFPITQYGTLNVITNRTPDWVRAGLLGDILRVYLGVEGFMSKEMRESRVRYERNERIAKQKTNSTLPVVSHLNDGINASKTPERSLASSQPFALASTQKLPPIVGSSPQIISPLSINPKPALPWAPSKNVPSISTPNTAHSLSSSMPTSVAVPTLEKSTHADVASISSVVLPPVLSLAPPVDTSNALAPVGLPELIPQQTILPVPMLAPSSRSNMVDSNMASKYDDLVNLLVNIPVTNEANKIAANLLSSLGF